MVMKKAQYDFTTGDELLEICRVNGISIAEAMIRREIDMSDLTREEIIEEMGKNLEVMKKSVEEGLFEQQSSVTGFTGGDALLLYKYATQSYVGVDLCEMIASAMGVTEVNSSMGQIVAAPTAGSSGVIPGCLISAAKRFGYSDTQLINALFTSAAVGLIIATNATLAGAEGGCQAEIGSAAAMAAAALVELRGKTPKQALNASAIAIKNIMGLVCDPVAGLVECPCIKRNGLGAANAAIAADMSISGIQSLIPFDEVVVAMRNVGRAMSVDLRETAKGGLAATPTGKELMRRMRQLNEE